MMLRNGFLAAPEQPETSAYFARVVAAGGAAPSQTQRSAYNTLVATGKTFGWFQKMDAFHPLMTYDVVAAKQNLVQNAYHLTSVGATGPSFAVGRGFTGTGSSTGYLNTSFNPTTASSPKFTQNSGHAGVWMGTATTANNIAGNNNMRLQVNVTGGTIGGRVNDGTTATSSSCGYVNDHVVVNRTASNVTRRYVGGIPYTATTTASTAIDNGNWSLCGNAGIASYTAAEISAFHYGSGLTDADVASIRAALKRFIIDIGSTVATSYTANDAANVGLLVPGASAFFLQNAAQAWSYTRDGGHHRFELRSGDVAANGGARSEAYHQTYWQQNTDIWCSYALMIESGTQSGNWHTFGQFHPTDTGPTAGYSPGISFDVDNDGATVTIEDNYNIGAGQVFNAWVVPGVTFSRDVIHRVVMNFKAIPGTPGTSYLYLWLDGVQVLSKTAVNIGHSNDANTGMYFKFGEYRGPTANTTEICHFWNVEVTNTASLTDRVTSPLTVYS